VLTRSVCFSSHCSCTWRWLLAAHCPLCRGRRAWLPRPKAFDRENGVMTSGWCIHPGGPQGYYLDCSVFLLASTWIQAAAQFPTRYTDA